MDETQAGITAGKRLRLERLHRSLPGPFTIREAATTLEAPVPETRRLLVYLASRGWLSRVRQGLYVVVPLGAARPSAFREDPWIAAAKAFAPCFIGGWSACEHWSLTEQLFRVVQVHTARAVRSTKVDLQGSPVHVHHVPADLHFGLKTVWRGQVRTQVSDPSRTVVDVLCIPELGGGIRHVAEVTRAYFGSEHAREDAILDYGDRLGNRTVFKRLGYLLETLDLARPSLVDACRGRISKGISLLDPSAPRSGTITKRWNLQVNVRISREEPS